jgi:UDP:flavonoid glycosyltransferase YjiC (YdhE family)
VHRKRVLITIQPFESHLRPVVPVARALRMLGHDVRIAAPASFTARIATYRLPFVDAGIHWSTKPAVAATLAATLGSRGNEAFVRQLFQEYLAGEPVTLAMARDVLDIADDWRPDLVLHDCVEFGGPLAAEVLGIAHASLDNGLAALVAALHSTLLADRLTQHRKMLGLGPEGELPSSFRHLLATPAPPGLVLSGPPNLVGYQHESPTREAEQLPYWMTEYPADEPLVYVMLGSIAACSPPLASMVVGAYRAILAGLADVRCRVIAAVGRAHVNGLGRQPSHIRVVPHAAQPLVLKTADVFFTHCGFGSLREALASAVPMIA